MLFLKVLKISVTKKSRGYILLPLISSRCIRSSGQCIWYDYCGKWIFFLFDRENNEDRTVDYWSAGTVAGSKEHLGTVKKASPSRKQGCCSNTQLAAVVAAVISPLSSSIVTARYVVVEQWPQQYIKHEQYQYRPQFLQHCMFFFSFFFGWNNLRKVVFAFV